MGIQGTDTGGKGENQEYTAGYLVYFPGNRIFDQANQVTSHKKTIFERNNSLAVGLDEDETSLILKRASSEMLNPGKMILCMACPFEARLLEIVTSKCMKTNSIIHGLVIFTCMHASTVQATMHHPSG